MTDYKDLKKEVLDSIIISANKDQIAFRTKSGWLYFYRGEIKSITGMHNLDDKYYPTGLTFKGSRFKDMSLKLRVTIVGL